MMRTRIFKISFILLVGFFGFYEWSNNDQTKNETISDQSPLGRDHWRAEIRDFNYSPEKVESARKGLQKKMSKLSSLQKDAGLGDWESIGPTKVGGRMRAITPHPSNPNILWVGGVSGGIWKSTDKGVTWAPKGDLMPSLAVTSILIHPTSPDTMFVSTGEGITARLGTTGSPLNAMPGAGILRSFDGGDTWAALPCINSSNEDEFYWINKIIFDPNDPSQIYAVGHGRDLNGVDPGANLAQDPLGVIHSIREYGELLAESQRWTVGGFIDIESNSMGDSLWVGSTQSLLLFTTPGGGFDPLFFAANLKNTNGFLDDDVMGRVEVAIAPSNHDIMYALVEDITETTFGYLMRSIDRGMNWDTTDMKIFGTNDDVQPFKNGNDRSQGWYDNTIWVSPDNPFLVIIGGIELWRSVDGGENFHKISNSSDYDYGSGSDPHADIHIIVEASDYSSGNKRIYVGTDGGIATTSDAATVSEGFGWELINNNLSITQFYASAVKVGVGILAGAQDNGTSFFDESSDTWSEVGGGDGGYCGFGQGDTIYFSKQNGRFHYKEDPSSNLEGILYGLSDNPAFIAPMVSFDGGAKVLMADSLLWYSDDPTDILSYRNISPVIAQPPGVRISAIDVDANNRVAIGYSNGWAFRANDIDANPVVWQVINSVTFQGYITDIAIHPDHFGTIAVSLGGYRDDNIWLTTDAGNAVWNEKSNGMPALHVNKLLWHHSEEDWLYAGSDLGVLATEDKGDNWNISPNFAGISDGPVFTEVTNLEWGSTAATTGARPLYVTTYGRGIWKSSDFIRGKEIYIDEDHVGFEFGLMDAPYTEIIDAENIQAHGQTWHIDGGIYTTSGSVIIDKRIGEVKKTGTGSIVIGEN